MAAIQNELDSTIQLEKDETISKILNAWLDSIELEKELIVLYIKAKHPIDAGLRHELTVQSQNASSVQLLQYI